MAQRLDPQRAGAREQVGDARAFERRAEIVVQQDVEDRLAHFVRCGPHARIARRNERTAAELASRDAHEMSLPFP